MPGGGNLLWRRRSTVTTSAPMTLKRVGRSPRMTKASAMMKNAWVCSTSDERPADIPQAIER